MRFITITKKYATFFYDITKATKLCNISRKEFSSFAKFCVKTTELSPEEIHDFLKKNTEFAEPVKKVANVMMAVFGTEDEKLKVYPDQRIRNIIFVLALYLSSPINIFNKSEKVLNSRPPASKLLLIVQFLYSLKTVNEIFKPIIADWREEYFEALFKKEIWKARWINVRYTYAFLGVMWQKSPLGDLVEFISKLAK